MKCAVALVLALIGIVVANPVGPLSYSIVSPVVVPSAVSVSSSVIHHGYTIPKVVAAPAWTVVKTPVLSTPWWGGYGWGGYRWGGWGSLGWGWGKGGH